MYHVEKREVSHLNGSCHQNGTQKTSTLKESVALMYKIKSNSKV